MDENAENIPTMDVTKNTSTMDENAENIPTMDVTKNTSTKDENAENIPTMEVEEFEKIMLNSDIITKVFKLLNCEDQLRFSQVNPHLGYIFKELIWKRQDYSTLHLFYSETNYIVANESNSHRKLLTEAGLQEFKSVYGVDVHKFKFKVEIEKAKEEPHMTEIMECLSVALFSGINPWINLTSLECAVPNIPTILRLVGEHLPYLNRLQLDELVWRSEREMEVEEMESLLKMKNLKRLCLNYLGTVMYKCQNYGQIIYELQLVVLEGSFIIDHDDCDRSKYYLQQELPLKELKIWTIFTRKNPIVNYSTILSIFENITKLHLKLSNYNTISEGLTDAMWTQTISSCKKLNILIAEWINFEDVTTFSIPLTVTKFRLTNCTGLTNKNLKYILTETNITEFISKGTYYYPLSEDFEDISISPLIERLDIDALDLCRFPSIYTNNKNLKDLTWHHIECLNSRSSRYTPECGSDLRTCINLETVEMPLDGQMCNSAVLELKYLRKLTISIVTKTVWADICAFLRHPPLRELHIRGGENKQKPPTEGISTDVTCLSVSSSSPNYIIDHALDFFLDILRKNSDMQLAILSHFNNAEEILKRLITSDSFPRDLKEVQLCGFTINCWELRNNFAETLKLISLPTHLELALGQMVLCRKKIGNVPRGSFNF